MRTIATADDRTGARDEIIAMLREQDVAVVPTDTVYGIVADAFRPKATMALRDVKELASSAPLTVLIRSPRQVSGLVSEIPEAADRLMASYWPGPLTLVLAAADGLSWDIGTRTVVALRMPTDELLLDVIADIGPVVCTAATVPAGQPPTTVDDARAVFGDRIGLYVDGGPREARWSTVVDLTREHPAVLREGAIPGADVELVAAGRVGWGQVPD